MLALLSQRSCALPGTADGSPVRELVERVGTECEAYLVKPKVDHQQGTRLTLPPDQADLLVAQGVQGQAALGFVAVGDLDH